jgi:crossover junction endodeoxyribonuclease RuvC
VIVVGIDPGLANLGIGVVREEGKTPKFVHAELVKTSSELEMPQRLAMLYRVVYGVLSVHQPQALAIEAQYFHERQAANAFKIGEAAGVILLAAAQLEIPVFEYGPMAVKQAIVGTGSASKEQVMFMVRATLALAKTPDSSHAADALALAMTHLASRRVREHAQLSRR